MTAAFSAYAAFGQAQQGSYSPVDFGDVAVIEGVQGSQVFTMDGQQLGTITDVEVDANSASLILEAGSGSDVASGTVTVTSALRNAAKSNLAVRCPSVRPAVPTRYVQM